MCVYLYNVQGVRPELTDGDEHEDLSGLETLMEGEPKQQLKCGGGWGGWGWEGGGKGQ